MLRRLALAAVFSCALPSSALANPSVSTSVAVTGVPDSLATRVVHTLKLTAGATEEKVAVGTLGSAKVTGAGVSVDEGTGTGPAVFRCAGRWQHLHAALAQRATFNLKLTIAPFATASLDLPRSFRQSPWAADTLDAVWHIAPAQGDEFDILSTGPDYAGARGVELGFGLTRRAARIYSVAGTAETGVNSGRVQLWGYAPGHKQARRLAVARVRNGEWHVPRLSLASSGRWEFYARYRSTGKRFADDASECGTLVRVR